MFEVYGLMILSQHLPFHMLYCGMTKEAAESVSTNLRARVALLHPHVMKLTESFGIAEHLLTSPIAQDFEEYNSRPNQGELPKL